MALSVVVASTDTQLTSTSSLKEVVGIGATTTAQDGYLDRLISRASRSVESFVGQPLTVQTYRETVAGFGRRRLMLSRTPIRAVLAVYEATDTGTATALDSSDLRVDADQGFVARDGGWNWTASRQGRFGWDALPLAPEPMPGEEYKPYLIDYIAGYTRDGIDTGSGNYSTRYGTSTGRTLPQDIEGSVLALAALTRETPDGAGVKSESLGDLSVTYGSLSSTSEQLQPWQAMLMPYARVK